MWWVCTSRDWKVGLERELGGGITIYKEAVQLGGTGWFLHSRTTACSSHEQLPAWGGVQPTLASLLLCLTTVIATAHLLPMVSPLLLLHPLAAPTITLKMKQTTPCCSWSPKGESPNSSTGGRVVGGGEDPLLPPSPAVPLQPHFHLPMWYSPRQRPFQGRAMAYSATMNPWLIGHTRNNNK